MRFWIAAALMSLGVAAAGCATTNGSYPDARRGEVSEALHGVPVPDPYRWMEGDASGPELRAWIEAQNALTERNLAVSPNRERIRERLTTLWDYTRHSVPWRRGDRYFWTRNDGLQAQAVLYSGSTAGGSGEVLLDPNTLSEDGTVALSGTWVNRDGSLLAYALSDGGSDWKEVHVRDVATGQDRPDVLKWVKFSRVTWDHSGSGFWYARYPAEGEEGDLQSANYFHKLYYHRLGTSQDDDVLVFDRPDEKEWGFGSEISHDGQTLVIYNWVGTEPKNRLFYQTVPPTGGPGTGPVKPLLTDFDAKYGVVGIVGRTLYIRTDNDAPRGRVIAVKLDSPTKESWAEVIPEATETLRSVSLLADDKLVASYMQDARSVTRIYGLDGNPLRDVRLPGLGTASGFGGEQSHSETFYSFTNYITPGTIYRYDVATGESEVLRPAAVEMNSEDWEIHQVFYTSKDGTRVPMFITHKRGLVRDGSHPTYLYGYGGFNISLTPYYSTVNRVWLEMGGVLAIPNLRGGGEYGKDWHDAGRRANKQNVFDDFHAAAEWLVAKGYTRADQLAIGGGSNGGLLVGASIVQRPELFGAALPAVGVLDMLRFHKFTIGWAWTSDYGDPDDEEDFKVLHAYSPLHNIREGVAYPSTLVTTGDHDDRVVPAHSFKFTAALQRAQAGLAPIFTRIETRAGHGAGKPTQMRIDEWADKWTFVTQALRMKLPAEFVEGRLPGDAMREPSSEQGQ